MKIIVVSTLIVWPKRLSEITHQIHQHNIWNLTGIQLTFVSPWFLVTSGSLLEKLKMLTPQVPFGLSLRVNLYKTEYNKTHQPERMAMQRERDGNRKSIWCKKG